MHSKNKSERKNDVVKVTLVGSLQNEMITVVTQFKCTVVRDLNTVIIYTCTCINADALTLTLKLLHYGGLHEK